MRRHAACLLVAVCVCLFACAASQAQDYVPYSPDELDELLAPIALYPDPLLAQILPAATYPEQIDAAQELLQGKVNRRTIDRQDWDVSVKAVAHYPEMLGMMYDDPDWTVALGQAFVEQQEEVFASVQRLRVRAYQSGNLVTTPQQRVVVADDGTILIVPVEAQRIYVPRYHPQQVYLMPEERDDSRVLIAFGAGLLIGVWLNRDIDWHRHHVYYHGWRATSGWVAVSRPHVVLVPVYVSTRFQRNVIPINRQIVTYSVPTMRRTISRQAEINAPVYREGHKPTTGVFAAPAHGLLKPSPRARTVHVPGPYGRRDTIRVREYGTSATPKLKPARKPRTTVPGATLPRTRTRSATQILKAPKSTVGTPKVMRTSPIRAPKSPRIASPRVPKMPRVTTAHEPRIPAASRSTVTPRTSTRSTLPAARVKVPRTSTTVKAPKSTSRVTREKGSRRMRSQEESK